MRNNQNKHGPDVDIGVWYAALLRHSEAASGDSDAGKAARAGPTDCACLLDAVRQGLQIAPACLTQSDRDCACLLDAVRQGLRPVVPKTLGITQGKIAVPIAIGNGSLIPDFRNRSADLLNLKSEIRNPKLRSPQSPDPRPPEKDWPPGSSISQKRRRQRPRSTIVNRRTGESPPGIVDDLITSNIDSIAQRKRTIRGCILQGRKRLFYP
jgi:hypothetical protein